MLLLCSLLNKLKAALPQVLGFYLIYLIKTRRFLLCIDAITCQNKELLQRCVKREKNNTQISHVCTKQAMIFENNRNSSCATLETVSVDRYGQYAILSPPIASFDPHCCLHVFSLCCKISELLQFILRNVQKKLVKNLVLYKSYCKP